MPPFNANALPIASRAQSSASRVYQSSSSNTNKQVGVLVPDQTRDLQVRVADSLEVPITCDPVLCVADVG